MTTVKKIQPGFILPSAALTVPKSIVKTFQFIDNYPQVGDLVYGKVQSVGQHTELENKLGRIHKINIGTKSIFVFGNRYAPDAYEALVPKDFSAEVDLHARSGIIGNVVNRNATMKDPTRIKILGYVVDVEQKIINTTDYCFVKPKNNDKLLPRSKMILVVGTSMNSGKSRSCSAVTWALSSAGKRVRGTKVTGTASLKDILHMEDAGASNISDFSYFGYPSTYMLSEPEVLDIFNKLDLKYANNPNNYWVVEIADGILQRETMMLLNSDIVRSRIHKLVFAARDAFGAIGGVKILKEKFNLVPDAISGVCSSSPLTVLELMEHTKIPIFDNMVWNLEQLLGIIL